MIWLLLILIISFLIEILILATHFQIHCSILSMNINTSFYLISIYLTAIFTYLQYLIYLRRLSIFMDLIRLVQCSYRRFWSVLSILIFKIINNKNQKYSPSSSLLIVDWFYFFTVSFGAFGYVIWGVQFLPNPKTFSSYSFLLYFNLLAFSTFSIYFYIPTEEGWTVTRLFFLPIVLFVISGLKVKFSSSNSFKYFYCLASYYLFSFSYCHFIDLSAIEYPCSYCNIISFIFVPLLLSAYWLMFLNS